MQYLRKYLVAYLLVLVVSLLAVSTELVAQPISRPYPFDMTPLDTNLSNIFDELRGPVLPLAGTNRIKLSNNGHLVDQTNDRVKLFGTSLWFNAQFLSSEDAKQLAVRLRKLGFNAVRFVYNDYFGWDDASLFSYYSTWPEVNPSSYTVNPVQLARFDTLLYELKQNGIYAVLNLNTSHGYSYGEGVWQWDSTYSNAYLHHFWDQGARELQKNWAKALLTHVNPLTGVALAQDPMVAYVSLNYEQSLYYWWRIDRLNYANEENKLTQGLQTISYHQSKRLDSLFNLYLKKKYTSQEKLLQAWGGTPVVNAPNVVDNGSFENFTSGAWSLTTQNGASAGQLDADGGIDSAVFAKLRITNLGPSVATGNIVFYNLSSRCDKDALYEFSFWSKMGYDHANRPGKVNRQFALAIIPYANTGVTSLILTQTIDTTWRKYTYTFRCDADGLQYIYMQMGNDMGDIWFDAFSIKRTNETPLSPGENLASSTIRRLWISELDAVPLPRAADMLMFYDSLEQGWYKELHASMKQIGYNGLVNFSQSQWWSLLPDIYKASRGDVVESHTGWDYVGGRPSMTYSDSTWMVRNLAMVRSTYGGTFGNMTANSVAKKAYIVGDHSTPWMNQYLSEHAIMLPAFASYQDWDGIFFTPFAAFREDLHTSKLPNQFVNEGTFSAIAKNPALISLLPAASNIFLNNRISRAEVEDTLIHDMNDVWLSPVFNDYRNAFGVEGNLDLNASTAFLTRQSFGGNIHKVAAEYPYLPDTSVKNFDGGEIRWDQTNGLFTIKTLSAVAGTGFFGANDLVLGPLTLSRKDGAKDILSFSLVPIDSALLENANSKLLTLSTRAQNTGQRWATDSLSFAKDFGAAPVIMSAATVEIALESPYSNIRVQPLDERGEAFGDPIVAVKSESNNTFTFTIDQAMTRSPWYRITEFNVSGSVESGNASDLNVEVYPNPASETITIRSTSMMTDISIVDLLGREAMRSTSRGHIATFDVSTLPQGHYSIVVETTNNRKVLPLRITQ